MRQKKFSVPMLFLNVLYGCDEDAVEYHYARDIRGVKMDNRKYVFVGNRFYVLDKMRNLGCNFERIFVVKDSFLEKELIKREQEYTLLPKKEDFIRQLAELDFDILISNGCPYILPISTLQKANQKYINIHPSLLPDLKGKHPINGAILYERKHGVTCHYMDDGIDTGSIISQIEIPITEEMDLDLLYQISFRMEGEVFAKAYRNGFAKIGEQRGKIEAIYYSRKEEDRWLRETDSVKTLMRKIRAFASPGLYARFEIGAKIYEVTDAAIIINKVISDMYQNVVENTFLIVTNKKVLVKFKGELVWLTLQDTAGINEFDSFLSKICSLNKPTRNTTRKGAG